MAVFAKICGYLLTRLYNCRASYENDMLSLKLGGSDRIIQYPFHISGVSNMIVGPSVNIGQRAMIMTTRAKIIIKGHFVAGPGLTIVTGDHMPTISKFIDDVSDEDKDRLDKDGICDQNVVIEEDVWCGANVMILKGVTIGRGSIIAAGAVVTRNVPPYSISGGVPSKVIKTRWTKQQIMEHEKALYKEDERFTEEEIEKFII